MARHPTGLYGRRKKRSRKQIGIISLLVIITVTAGFRYGHNLFGRSEDQATAAYVNRNAEDEINTLPAATPKPVQTPAPEPKSSIIIPEPESEPNPSVAELVDEALAVVRENPDGVIETRDRLNETLSMPMNNVQRALIKQELAGLADRWLYSRSVFPEDRLCSNYTVKGGDLLSAIGNRHKVPWEILAEINRISRPEMLKAGETIKVIHGPFHVRVHRSTFMMDL